VRASVFQNTIVHNGRQATMPKVVLEVRYKDKAGQWRGTNSFSLNELPKAILALQQVFEYLSTRRSSAPEPDDGEPAEPRAPSVVIERFK